MYAGAFSMWWQEKRLSASNDVMRSIDNRTERNKLGCCWKIFYEVPNLGPVRPSWDRWPKMITIYASSCFTRCRRRTTWDWNRKKRHRLQDLVMWYCYRNFSFIVKRFRLWYCEISLTYQRGLIHILNYLWRDQLSVTMNFPNLFVFCKCTHC